MPLFPLHAVSRIAAMLWTSACLVLLVITLLQSDLYSNERSALAMIVPVYFLAFPSGHIAVVAIAKLKLALYMSTGFEPSILAECVMWWTLAVVLGYVQWFMLLPWVARKCWQWCSTLANRGSE